MLSLKVLITFLVLNGIKTGEGAPSGPDISIAKFKIAVAKEAIIVYDPNIPTFTVKCSSKDSVPAFSRKGDLFFYVNDHLEKSEEEFSGDFKQLTITMNFTVGEDVTLKCVLSHPEKNATKEIKFISPNQTFDLERKAVTLLHAGDKVTLERHDRSLGLSTRLTQKWYRRMNESNEWVYIADNKELTVDSFATPGLQWYKLEVSQKNYFNVPITSSPTRILTYIPTTKVKIESPLKVCTKLNDVKTLKCSADGDPQPDVVWLRADEYHVNEFGNGAEAQVGHFYTETGLYKCGAVQHLLERIVVIESFQAVHVRVVSDQKQCDNGTTFL